MKRIVQVILALSISMLMLGCASQPESSNSDTPPPTAPDADAQKSTEPLILDNRISGNGLAVKYPSSWKLEEDQAKGKAYITPPCGGSIFIDLFAADANKAGQPITPDTEDSVISLCALSYFHGMAKGDTPINVSPDYQKKIDGESVNITSHMDFMLKGVKYVGKIYIGMLGTQASVVMASIPENADIQYTKTIDAIIDSIKLTKSDKQPDNSAPKKKEPPAPKATPSQSNAVQKASDYLKYSAFSYTGLIKQLEFEKFSTEDATYGADNCKADWNKQAEKKAQQYMKYSSFSRDGLIDQLTFEGFTYDQAVHGVDSVGL